MRVRMRACVRAWGGIALLMLGPLLPCAAVEFGFPMFRVVGAVESAEVIVRRLVELGRQAEFVGTQETTLFLPKRQSSRQRVIQRDGRRKVVYLSPPQLKGKEILVDGSRILFDDGTGTAAPDIGLGGELAELSMKHLGTAQVAGRKTHIVEIRPPSRANASRKVWIDAQEWVPLCWEERDAEGNLVSKTRYITIRFGGGVPRIAPPAAASRSVAPPSVQMTPAEAEKMAGFPVREPRYLPKGYHRQAVSVISLSKGHRGAYSINLVYSNGLDLITLWQTPAALIQNAPRPGKPRVSAFGQWVWVRGGYHYTLSATPPLPKAEMHKVIESIP
ncbi:MAG TPA: hypothetical protein GX715_14380 [Armatimonadetes bacterium]|nr:hypothetical protein [Armatimonadota bacterium]